MGSVSVFQVLCGVEWVIDACGGELVSTRCRYNWVATTSLSIYRSIWVQQTWCVLKNIRRRDRTNHDPIQWVASKSCSSSSCKKASLYDPSSSSSAQQTGKDFSIQYLSGQVQGPIYWDSFTLGGYGIDNQALGACRTTSSHRHARLI